MRDAVKAALGRRVKELRKARGMTLEKLGRCVGLTAPTLSKIENASLSVTYDTLVALSEALSVGVTELFADGRDELPTARRDLTRAGEGDVYETDVYRYEMLCPNLARKKIIPIRATIKAHSIEMFPRLISHAGEEFVYVLAGVVELRTEHYQPTVLRQGDSAYFDSRMGHALLSAGETDATILWVCTNLVEDAVFADRLADHAQAGNGEVAHERTRASDKTPVSRNNFRWQKEFPES